MKVGPRFPNSKFHGGTSNLAAQLVTHGVGVSMSSGMAHSGGIPGEMRDPGAERPAQFLTMDYGEQRHLAYDSPLAQPAYTAHGKVKTF